MFFNRIEKLFAKSRQQVFSPKYILVVVARWIFSASCCQRKNLFPCQRCTEGRSSKLNAQKGGVARRTDFLQNRKRLSHSRAGALLQNPGKAGQTHFSNKKDRPSFRFWVQFSFHNIYRENYPVLSLDM